MSDSGNIDSALIAKLAADVTLMASVPDGVFIDVAPSGKTKFVIVSLVISDDEQVFNDRAYERATYLVKSVTKGTSGSVVKAAASRIEDLLDGQALTVTGFSEAVVLRDERVRYVEVDDDDPDNRWQHSGARYSVFVSR